MATKRIAIFGSTGQLGTDLVEVLLGSQSFEVFPLSHQDADCADAEAVRKVLLATCPQIVINCAAFVRVDDCEDRVEEAFRVNAIGAFNIAKSCAELDALCVYVSTDYVFDGSKATPYVESDSTLPINVYGTSKLAGELFVRQTAPRWLIVRVASLFGKTGARGKGGNFIETILSKARQGETLKVVDDIRISPSYTRDAAVIIGQLLAKNATGIVHAANTGSCTWYELARSVLATCDISAQISPTTSDCYPTRARRPKNSALESERLAGISGFFVPTWQDGLMSYLVEKGHVASPKSATVH